ncbi:hypothetical protein V8D89_001913 [Ganoderma adspersum]
MTSGEDQLPPKQRLPRTFRTCVGNDTKARSHCPINGTRPFNIVKFSYHRQRDHERKRKAQAEVRRVDAGIERQTAGSDALGTSGIEKTECFHSWSIHDPAAAALPVDHHFATMPARACTVPRQPSSPLPAATNAQEQHIPEHNVIQFQPPNLCATATATSSRPRSTYIADSAFAAHPATTRPDLETNYSSSTALSTSPPTVKLEGRQVSAATPSALIAPEHNPASRAGQGSIWSEDDFIAAYQAFFLPCPISDSRSPAQALGPIHHDPDNATAQQANGGPALEANMTKPTCTDSATATVSYACATKLEDGEPIDWSLRLMAVAPADPQQSEALKMAATAGYARTLNLQRGLISSGVPEEAYAAMHPSPPKIPSSYSELAHALECTPHPSTRIYAMSGMRGPATTLCPALFNAQPSMSLHAPASSWGTSLESGANPLTIFDLDNEDERARFDASNRSCSEVELLELSLCAFFATRQTYSTCQQLLATK